MLQLSEDDQLKDMCPICKTDKYLSPNMKFLINPECYHKICESCVDRIFSLGPAPCPYPKCGKILRKNKFKQQIFEDLKIEREIDIRRKVGSIYNKTEEDFPNLKEFNKYIENIEEIVFNLNNGIDVEKTEQELNKYEQDHKIEILEKNMRESQKTADINKYQDSMERLKQEKLKIQKKMEIEDLEFSNIQKQDLLDKLTNSSMTSEELIKQQQSQLYKRNQQRKKQLQQINNQLDLKFNSVNPLQKQIIDGDNSITPFTPFQGDRDLNKKYDILKIPNTIDEIMNIENTSKNSYQDPYLFDLAKNKEYLGSGWRINNIFERALDEAFIGLGCNIEREKSITT
ncbi:TFB3 [Candida jiufengensis]|uniref:TFB3 n=1 Tax=Candida jiufengensis TaxID=497108 RepID=UPI00222509E9|nr:TFB3 [Candida jiufengensis]KAI5956523.1 TFB3 [Candida jiufengensis]